MELHIKDLFEKKARAGDGLFAIAYALVDLADSQEATAKALKKLGLADAATDFGALEALGMAIERAGQSIADQIEGAGQAISTEIGNIEGTGQAISSDFGND